jgi:hypothetical protein
MAKAIERYFNVALYLLVVCGFGALASTGGLDLPAFVLVGLALALRGYQLLTRREFVIPERWTTFLTLIYVVFLRRLLCSFAQLSGATVHLVLFCIGRSALLAAADARPLHAGGTFVWDGAGRRRAYEWAVFSCFPLRPSCWLQ